MKLPRSARRTSGRLNIFVAGALIASVVCRGQVTLREDVKQVLVPVVVTDKNGHHVTGLHAADFHISEDGIPQDIVAFTTSKSDSIERRGNDRFSITPPRPSPDQPPPRSSADTPKRTYVICIDTLHSSFANFGRVRQALTKFFAQEEAGDAQYALFTIGREIKVLQDSTRDPSRILSAISDKQFLKTILESESARIAGDVQQFTYFMRDDYCNKCECTAFNTREWPGCPAAQSRLQLFLLRSGERMAILDRNFYSALQQVAAATAAMPTSRTILFVSDGFNRFPGRELYAVMSGFGPKDRRFEFNSRDTDNHLRSIVKTAVQNNVRFYTIDSRGLYTLSSIGGSTFDASSGSGAYVPQTVDSNTMTVARENTDALSELARETGGLFFENNNDLFKGIQRAFADGREYYVLAYVPKNKSAANEFRRIHVDVSKKGLQVNAKPGYWPSGN